ncbi:MAG: hypothetical protein ASARMPRED_009148 [Alectoria sarmentosa]|nr:MAG: hypothetical protein ASARMPRED_009148 [Alectoria sarmentosa]
MHEPARMADAVRNPILSWKSDKIYDPNRDSEASENGGVLRSPGRNIMLGACTGSIVAIAAACVTSVTELLAVGPEIVSIAVRLGLEVLRRSDNIEPSYDNWTIAILNSSVTSIQSMLDTFHQSQVRDYKPAEDISANLGYSVYPRFGGLISVELQQSKVVPVPVTGAFHALHLELPDIERIIGQSSILDLQVKQRTSIILGSGRELKGSDMLFKALMREALTEILRIPQDMSAMEDTLESGTRGMDSKIFLIGPANFTTRIKGIPRPTQFCRSAASSSRQLDQGLRPSDEENDIAVVGMSGRFPGSDNLEEFWEILSQGRDLCQQRLVLMSTYEALERAGYSYESKDALRVGTFIGQSSDDWREANAGQDIDTFFIPGGIRAFVSGRLNYHFGWEGPAFGIDTACSSSAASIDLACASLLSNKCDAAIAGGGNIMTASDMFAGLSRGGVLSPSGACKTWDETADGYCRADGVGVVVLKRLRSAIANRDNVLAIIKSTATIHSPTAPSITHPHAPTQAKLIYTVLKEAGIRPDQVDYVEMHGTGTQAGDVAETSSVQAVFGRHRTRDRPLYIGTVKPNIGHSEAASGVTSVMKAVMMFKKSTIPRHIGIKTVMNKNIPDLMGSNILIPSVETPFVAHRLGSGERNILVNNFNITSGYTSLLLRDGFKPAVECKDLRSAHVFTISAHSPAALHGNLSRLSSYLSQDPHISLPDLSYSMTARRMHHSLRQAFVAKNVSDLSAAVKTSLMESGSSMASQQPVPVIFVFSMQASQYTGMGRRLFETCSVFRMSILRSERICQNLGLPSFLGYITDSAVISANFDNLQSQLALTALEVALADLWRSWGVEPVAVIGHSLGEYPALFIAGVYSLTDMFYLIGRRSCILKRNCVAGTYSMLSVHMAMDRLERILLKLGLSTCEIACHNSLDSNVVSGPANEIEMLKLELEGMRVKTTLLQLPYAFHSAQMDPSLEEFEAIALEVPFQKPQVMVASTVKSTIIQEKEGINAAYIAQHMRKPVKFLETLQELESSGVADNKTLWIEIGPGTVCTNMVKNILAVSPEQCLTSMARNHDDWETLAKSLAKAYKAGINIKWREYHREYETALHLIDLPSYAFDLKSFWIQYEGDWCLRKGQGWPAPTTKSPPPGLESTTLQKVESEELGVDEAFVVFASDLREEQLYSAITAHMVNDSGLCSSSIYADMAITAASYIWGRIRPDEKMPAFDVSSMKVGHPLIVNTNASTQIINISAKKERKSDDIKMRLVSVNGTESVQHADWTVVPGDGNSWMQTWANHAYLYQSRIASLRHPSTASQVHHLLGSLVYKLFSVIVTYGPKYRGIQEVFMDGESSEATARVSFQSNATDGKFACSPYWIDSLAQLSGFVLNGSDTAPQDTVFISHGWDSMRFAQPLSEDHTYTTYVKMQKTGEKGVMAGDVLVLHDDVVVAIIAGLRFQAIKKRVLSTLLPKTGEHAPPKNTAPSPSSQASRPLPTGQVPTPGHRFRSSNISAASALIAAQLCVDPAILENDAILADLGVDSLLILEIQAKLRSDMNIDIPSSYFSKPSTMGDLKRYVERTHAANAIEADLLVSNKENDSDYKREIMVDTQSKRSVSEINSIPKAQEIKKSIAEELGIAVTELEPHARLLDLGVDSMLTLSIIDSVRSSTGQHIPANFFILYPTWSDIQTLFETETQTIPPIPALAQTKTAVETPASSNVIRSTRTAPPPRQVVQPPTSDTPPLRCSTTLLQFPVGVTVNSPSLILLPEGSGSPAPYTALPTLHPSFRIMALSSPFLTNPSAFTLSLVEVSTIFSNTIMHAAPTGALILAGYSIGGVYAHEIAKQLLERGRDIKGLLLLDSPCPQTLPAIEPDLLRQVLDILEQLGTLKKLSPNMREHFVRNTIALEQHNPSPPSAAARQIPCEAICATRGVLDSLNEAEVSKVETVLQGESPVRDWLLKKRSSVGPQGWEDYFEEVRCETIDADHFSFFKEAHVSTAVLTVPFP